MLIFLFFIAFYSVQAIQASQIHFLTGQKCVQALPGTAHRTWVLSSSITLLSCLSFPIHTTDIPPLPEPRGDLFKQAAKTFVEASFSPCNKTPLLGLPIHFLREKKNNHLFKL